MAGRFSRSLELARASWSVVSADRELLWLPLMSVAATLIAVGTFIVPVVWLGAPGAGASLRDAGSGAWLGGLLFYVVAYFITIFFNTALVGAAMTRLEGGDPTLASALGIAWARVGRIFGYACIAATVGLLLRALERRAGVLGRLVVRLLGVAWSLATFLVVPVLVTRDVGPLEAVQESARLLRETWGENLIGTAGLGIAFSVAYLALFVVGGAAALLAAQAGQAVVVGAVLLVGVVALCVLATLHATLQGVYSAALYRYATGSAAPLPGLGADRMQAAFRPKA